MYFIYFNLFTFKVLNLKINKLGYKKKQAHYKLAFQFSLDWEFIF